MNIEFYDVDGDLKSSERKPPSVVMFTSVGANVLALDTEKAKYMIGILSHYAETGELREPINEESPAEEAATNSLGDEIKALSDAHGELVEACARTDAFLCKLTERVAALEQVKKPQPYGLWSLQWGNWHSGSPWESAGEATDYATQSFYPDWRNYWRVYPYPEDGGKPVELREEKWGLWGGTGGSEPYWFGQEDEGVCLESEEDIQEVRSLLEFPERWKPYPYPADGGMPMELREGKKQIDRPTVYYVRNKTTGNFLRRVDQKDRNTLFVTEDQTLAEHMAQGTEGGPYEVYPVTLGE